MSYLVLRVETLIEMVGKLETGRDRVGLRPRGGCLRVELGGDVRER